ncbi:hypothetical protein ANN_06411 [Periplaneta americana]|uniref:Uncharacterized protein n=1 Tax=Periplaneta americana TaxID=6978 RepID=A0ABQ8TFZ4_PERAM|nr:hypothetical protein ANN_06411 [Periplaneta americana]
MAGLCEGCSKPPGSLKTITLRRADSRSRLRIGKLHFGHDGGQLDPGSIEESSSSSL